MLHFIVIISTGDKADHQGINAQGYTSISDHVNEDEWAGHVA
jgi:hypothetical protein